jgi:thiol-disulfide isomerase/thioredoxin
MMKKFRVQMKVVSSVLAAALTISCPTVFASGNQPAVSLTAPTQLVPIHWSASFVVAQQEARANGKLIMIDFYTDWCGWCKLLDEQTYPDNRVKLLASNFVTVKLNAEKDGAKLAKKYGVDAYPTIMFVNADGSAVKKVDGYQDGADFTTTLAQILQKNRGPALKQMADGQPGNVTLQTGMAIINAAAGSMDDALKYQGKAETADPHNQAGALSAGYQTIAEVYFGQKQYAQSIDYLKKQIATCGSADEAIVAKLMMATCYAFTKQNAQALQLAEEVLHTPSATKEEKELAQKIETHLKTK